MDFNTNPPHPLVGAWELVTGSYVGEDGVAVDYAQSEIHSLKVLSGGKFSFVTTTHGAFYAAAAGDYAAEAGLYMEIPALASQSEMLGQRYEFQFLLQGDTWENSRFQGGVRVEHEVWKRVQ